MAPVILELTSQAKEMGGNQTEMNAVTARTEDEGSAWNMVGEKGVLRGNTAVEIYRSRKQGSMIQVEGIACVGSKVAAAWHLGKEGRETEDVRAGAGSWGFWLERLNFT